MKWEQTRRTENRICWTTVTAKGALFRLRATQVAETVVLELYRTDRAGALADRRDGWKETIANPSGDLDPIKNIALTWAALRVGA